MTQTSLTGTIVTDFGICCWLNDVFGRPFGSPKGKFLAERERYRVSLKRSNALICWSDALFSENGSHPNRHGGAVRTVIQMAAFTSFHT